VPDAEDSSADPVASWIEKIQEGIDVEHNFGLLYKHFHPRLFVQFHRWGFAAPRCEELTQDVLFRVFKNIGTFERRSRFATWLHEIVHNVYVNELRRIKAAKRDGFEVPIQEENGDTAGDDEPRNVAPALVAEIRSPYEETEHREQAKALREALATLPPQMRRCVYLRLYQGLKYREVAEILHVSIDTVKAQLGTAKVRLKQLLGSEAGIVKRLTDEDPEPPEK
jgi:RNA polymerase sigma-70 factor (ECF subfamily)